MSSSAYSTVPSGAEGDVNHSSNRKDWQAQHLDDPSRSLLQRDSDAFLHQSVSTPDRKSVV